MDKNFLNLPTETIKLVSEGVPYNEKDILSKGELEMKYQTAREEDILTNINYISNKTVFKKLIQSMVLTPGFKYEDLLIGDKEGLLIDARILGEGAKYPIQYYNSREKKMKEHVVDLSKDLKPVKFHKDLEKGKMEYDFTLPKNGVTLTFHLMTTGIQEKIDRELDSIEEKTGSRPTITTTLRYQITAINGERDKSKINQFIPNILKQDVKALLKYMNEIEPKLDLTIDIEDETGYIEENVKIPIGLNFFWPE